MGYRSVGKKQEQGTLVPSLFIIIIIIIINIIIIVMVV